jgi:hypothetical protein
LFNEIYSKILIGKIFYDSFPIQNGLKQGDALSLLPFNFALKYAIRKVQDIPTMKYVSGLTSQKPMLSKLKFSSDNFAVQICISLKSGMQTSRLLRDHIVSYASTYRLHYKQEILGRSSHLLSSDATRISK